MDNKLTQERLKELLHYDPSTGVFTRRVATSNRVKLGKPAGWLNDQGYVLITFAGMDRRAHRLAWLYIYGDYPTNGLDHRNGIRSDNRISNLRLANQSENQQNQCANKGSTSGKLGVYLHKPTGRWAAQITHQYRHMYIGLFDTIDEAHAAYLSTKQALHTFNPIPRSAHVAH